MYQTHLRHANEAVLKEDLYTLRNAIDQYTQDKAKAPQSLDDVVSAGYLRMLPKDPFTNSNTTLAGGPGRRAGERGSDSAGH